LVGNIAAGLLWGGVLAQASAQGIYTCVDAKGRNLTADRPIADCLDREQRELTPGGTVKRKIGPVLTAEERAAEEEKARKAAEERNRLAEEKKRERALLARYPNKAVHDKERAMALAVAEDAIAAAKKSTGELAAQRKKLDIELEFYKSDASKVPAQLKRQIEENQQHAQAQERFIANQDNEKQRINARFDEELAKLRQLWAQRAGAATVGAAPASAAKR
jgi:hypothetical protein